MRRKRNGLSYSFSGNKGPVVVLLHAFPLDGSMWKEQKKALSRHARVLVPDLPGFGRSKNVAAPSISKMAESVAALLDKLSIPEPVVVMGLSMGGYIALEFVRLFPERTRALGLFATRAGADSAEGKKKRFEQIKNVRAKGVKPLMRAMSQKLLGKTTLGKRPKVVRRLKKVLSLNEPKGVVNALRAMAGRRDNERILRKVSGPALIVAGGEDGVIPLDQMRLLHKKIRKSKFRVIKNAGHLLNLEEPRVLNSLLSGWLKKV